MSKRIDVENLNVYYGDFLAVEDGDPRLRNLVLSMTGWYKGAWVLSWPKPC